MAGSAGYEVAGTDFPAVPITIDDVEQHLTELGVREPSVEPLETKPEVPHGYTGMIVATGFASYRRLGRGSSGRRAMEIQTRRHILEIWRATVEHCYREGQWRWGGRSGRNSISDAEQLLTILYPATIIESLNIDCVGERG
jgi:hypothetical protein